MIFDKILFRCFLNRKALLVRIGILCENKQKEKYTHLAKNFQCPYNKQCNYQFQGNEIIFCGINKSRTRFLIIPLSRFHELTLNSFSFKLFSLEIRTPNTLQIIIQKIIKEMFSESDCKSERYFQDCSTFTSVSGTFCLAEELVHPMLHEKEVFGFHLKHSTTITDLSRYSYLPLIDNLRTKLHRPETTNHYLLCVKQHNGIFGFQSHASLSEREKKGPFHSSLHIMMVFHLQCNLSGSKQGGKDGSWKIRKKNTKSETV